MKRMPGKTYPVDSKDYKLYEEVGDGVSAIVYRAICIPFNEIVAIKVLDLERCNNDLDGIRQEVHTMTLIDHPNVLRAHCSFAAGHNLWVVMPYMAGGSCMHIMKSSYPEGLEEPVIATLLRETLNALVYLHAHGHIHRDVKAGNILLDTNGTVKLGDFGVSASTFDAGDRQRSRNTFVGTPCWMAPEVMQQLHGYDFKADIWSFGITALELAHGHAPFSKYPPMKVLLMTLQNAPPGLDYERDKRFSKSFKELVAACLVKDPKKRPTSEKLLKHNFFKHAKTREYLTRTVLDGLPPLGERCRMLKAKEADLLEQNKALYGDKEHLSQQEYIRGISAWNFNLEDLKNQAALIQDDDSISCQEDVDSNCKQNEGCDDVAAPVDKPSAERTNGSNPAPNHEDTFEDMDSLEGSFASFPIQPLQALKGYFDVGEDDANGKSPSQQSVPSDADIQSSSKLESHQTLENDIVKLSIASSLPKYVIPGQKKVLSGPLLPENIGSRRNIGEGDRESLHGRCPSNRNYSGTLLYRQKKDMNNVTSVEDASEGSVVKRRGRFKVTSADLSPQASTNNFFNPVSVNTAGQAQNISATSLLPALQYILQQNNMQREEIIKLIKCVEQSSGNRTESTDAMTNGNCQAPPASGEAELMSQANYLQKRIGSLVEELQRQKVKNAQLEKRLNDLAMKQGESVVNGKP